MGVLVSAGAARKIFAAYIPDGDVGRYAAGLAAQLRRDFTGTMSLLRDPQFQDLLVNYPRAPRTFYLGAQLNLAEFKTKVDGINKRNAFWGFKGPKGQMFFNMVVSVAADRAKCDQEIKAAIKVPLSEAIACEQIKLGLELLEPCEARIEGNLHQRGTLPSVSLS